MQLFALLGLRPWLIIAAVVAVAVFVGGPMLKAHRLESRLAATTEQLADATRERDAAMASAATLQQAARELAEREQRARNAVAGNDREERLLRAEIGDLRRQLAKRRPTPAPCACDSALDILRDRQSSRGRPAP